MLGRSGHDREILRLALPALGALAARFGDASLGAHLIAFQLFGFLALVLDSVAIAGQVIVGRRLGAADPAGARAGARRMIGWSTACGCLFGVVLLTLAEVLPRVFTPDPADGCSWPGWASAHRSDWRPWPSTGAWWAFGSP